MGALFPWCYRRGEGHKFTAWEGLGSPLGGCCVFLAVRTLLGRQAKPKPVETPTPKTPALV